MSMMLPATLELGPFTYTVSEDWADIDAVSEEIGSPLFAFIDEAALEILIEPSQAEDQKRDSLLHECLHGLVFLGGLEVEESVIRSLSPLLLALLRDNPPLVAYLTEP